MAKRRRQPRTVLEACTQARGLHKGALTAAHVGLVVMATGELGHVPSGSEYARWGGINERTAFRQWEGIAEVFGEDWRTVIEALAEYVEREHVQRSPGAIRALPVVA